MLKYFTLHFMQLALRGVTWVLIDLANQISNFNEQYAALLIMLAIVKCNWSKEEESYRKVT